MSDLATSSEARRRSVWRAAARTVEACESVRELVRAYLRLLSVVEHRESSTAVVTRLQQAPTEPLLPCKISHGATSLRFCYIFFIYLHHNLFCARVPFHHLIILTSEIP